ncbi:MAG: minor capsid protein [Azoarcus sp.]|jgi:SPP1 gp7 family putative phage head morphogenesis protein|nr:minor capsid protein [Azoarcus sp.]
MTKIRLSKKKAEWAGHWKPQTLRGKPLVPSAAEEIRFRKTIVAMTERMTAQVTREVMALAQSPAAGAMDAPGQRRTLRQTTGSIASQSRILMARLRDRMNNQFARVVQKMAARMVGNMFRSARLSVQASIRKATDTRIPLTALQSGALNEIVKASATQTAHLIRRIPQKYLDQVEGALMRSISSQAGTGALYTTLQDEVQRHNITIKNWAYNTARDQTTKVFSDISREQMRAAGVKRFEWLHSGGGSEPRPLHVQLSGQVFSMDDPPVIQEAKGKTPEIRGFPGQLINCRCKMIPVLEFQD